MGSMDSKQSLKYQNDDTLSTSELHRDLRDLRRHRRPQKTIEESYLQSDTLSTTREFVRKAAAESPDVAQAARESLGEWQSTSWHFTRMCKGHPSFKNVSAAQAFEAIDWSLTGFDEEERMQFLREWNRVKCFVGWSPVDWAVSMASQKPLGTDQYRAGLLTTYARFISIAGWLQVVVGDRDILLPCEKLAGILGCSKKIGLKHATNCHHRRFTDSYRNSHHLPGHQISVCCREVSRPTRAPIRCTSGLGVQVDVEKKKAVVAKAGGVQNRCHRERL